MISPLIDPADPPERQTAKLLKVTEALMARVERATDDSGEAYAHFQRAIVLEEQVRSRTEAWSNPHRKSLPVWSSQATLRTCWYLPVALVHRTKAYSVSLKSSCPSGPHRQRCVSSTASCPPSQVGAVGE
jgi:hypothetical protein